jgi:hypothetical protein
MHENVWRVDHVKNTFTSFFVIIGQYVHIILLRNHINGFCLCITGRKCYTFGPLYHVITLLLCYSPMTWSTCMYVSFHSFITSCHWAIHYAVIARWHEVHTCMFHFIRLLELHVIGLRAVSAVSRFKWTTIFDITWRSNSSTRDNVVFFALKVYLYKTTFRSLTARIDGFFW